LGDDDYRPSLDAMLRVHTPTEAVSSLCVNLPPQATGGGGGGGGGGGDSKAWRARLWDGGGRREARHEAVSAFVTQLSTQAQEQQQQQQQAAEGEQEVSKDKESQPATKVAAAAARGVVLCVVAMSDIDRAVVADDSETERMEEALDHLVEISSAGTIHTDTERERERLVSRD